MGATRSLTSPLRTRARYTGAVRRRLRLHGSHGQFDRWIEPAMSGARGALVYICQAVRDRAGLERYWRDAPAAYPKNNVDVLAAYGPFEVLDADEEERVEGVVIAEFLACPDHPPRSACEGPDHRGSKRQAIRMRWCERVRLELR